MRQSGANVMKLFSSSLNASYKKSSAFVPNNLFQSSLIFVG
jgi:hypothetical protein